MLCTRSPSLCLAPLLPPLLHALFACSKPPDKLLYLSRSVVKEVCSSNDNQATKCHHICGGCTHKLA